MKYIWESYKTNGLFKKLTKILFLAAGIVLTNAFLRLDSKEFVTANNLLLLLSNISYAYIASYVFYIINVLLPQVKKREESLDAISYQLARLQYNFDTVLLEFSLDLNTFDLEHVKLLLKQHAIHNSLVLTTEFSTVLYGDLKMAVPELTEEQVLAADCYHAHFKGSYSEGYSPDCTIYNAFLCTLFAVGVTLDRVDSLAGELTHHEKHMLDSVVNRLPVALRENTTTNLFDTVSELTDAELAYTFHIVGLKMARLFDEFPAAVRDSQGRHTEHIRRQLKRDHLERIYQMIVQGRHLQTSRQVKSSAA